MSSGSRKRVPSSSERASSGHMPQELPCVECVRHREPTPLPTNMTSTAILRVCSGILVATRKGHSRARHDGHLADVEGLRQPIAPALGVTSEV